MFCLYPFFFLFLWRAGVAAINRTIDDTVGDALTGNRPVYLPQTPGIWEDATCKGCAIQPDKNKAFRGTWNAATYNPALGSLSIELSFKGTAVYVFFILANNIGNGITTETACNFTLDGNLAGSFHHIPSGSLDLEYNALVYSTNSLPNIDHKLLISTSGVDRNIFLNFDYAIYTVDDTPTSTLPPATTSKVTGITAGSTSQIPIPDPQGNKNIRKTPVGTIVGAAVGGVAVLSALILALLFCRRKRKPAAIDHTPSNLAASPHLYSEDSNSPFITVTPAMAESHASRYTHSDFLQSGTIAPSHLSVDVGRNSDLYDDPNHDNSPNTGTSQDHHPMTNRNIIATLPTGEIMMSASTGPGPTSGRVPPPLLVVNDPENNTEVVRRARQQELDRQVRMMKREMRDLKTGMNAEVVRQPSIQSTEIARIKEQMRAMSEQIEFLHAQRHSEWAQGLSDAPPPGYSPRE